MKTVKEIKQAIRNGFDKNVYLKCNAFNAVRVIDAKTMLDDAGERRLYVELMSSEPKKVWWPVSETDSIYQN